MLGPVRLTRCLVITFSYGAMRASPLLRIQRPTSTETPNSNGDSRFVPLVAASMGMYDLAKYPTDSFLWEFMAYCAGTGGSILIIGSAAGVAAMGLERIDFLWYLRKVSALALAGYLAGAMVYLVQFQWTH